MQYLALAVSVLGLIVAGATLYNTHLRHPRIHSYLGPLIKLYYPGDGGTGIYIPITFINSAPRVGTVLRAAILLHRKDSTQEQYFMEWGSFSRLDTQSGNWVYENICHALPVDGKSSITKVVWFNWLASSQPSLIFKPGEYVLTLFYWLGGHEQPKTEIHELHISDDLSEALEGYRAEKRSTTVELALDKHLARNSILTSDAAQKLLRP